MIREMRSADLDAVAAIWLDTNLEAHDFIPARYWQEHFEPVKKMLREAELYVYEDTSGIQGFIGLDGGHIAGLFVRSGARSRGIGRQLLDHVKTSGRPLTLHVYQRNARAVRFYQREGFTVRCESIDESTGEREYLMGWGK